MAYRNGIVADVLRRAGMNCYDVIFGVNLPDLAKIADTLPHTRELAKALWADHKVRESRLLASYLFPYSEMSDEEMQTLLSQAQTPEEANLLRLRQQRSTNNS